MNRDIGNDVNAEMFGRHRSEQTPFEQPTANMSCLIKLRRTGTRAGIAG
jgi:hypothetical protein